ncbi:MAG: DUF58 domain-containing protein [Myxococcales bacterium]
MHTAQLLDPVFARELEALRRRLRVRARSGAGGEHLAKRRGGSAEFLEHRAYSPGDDLRRIDWLAFARTGEPMLKLFRSEEDLVVRLVVDASSSLEIGSKLDVAKRAAAAIGYLALAGSERAQVLTASDGLTRVREPSRGRGALTKLLRELDEIVPGGLTDLARAIDGAVLRADRPGLLAVISDFFDPGPVAEALGRAASAGHDIAIVQVLARDEVEPSFDGDLAFVDSETGAIVEVTCDARAVEAYLARLNALLENLRRIAKRHRGTYVRITTGEPMLDAIRRFVARGVD